MIWRLVGALAGVLAGWITRKALVAIWHQSKGTDPPSNPAAPSTTWGEALIFTIASAVGIGVARLLAQRGAAAVWEAATGELPPGLEEVTA
jgi:hypothetical protein